jgi:gliding motility-associated-like protein
LIVKKNILSILFLFNFCILMAGTTSPQAPTITIGSNDSVVFDLSNAILKANTLSIPVSIRSGNDIHGLDFAVQFNEQLLTFDSVLNQTSYLDQLSHYAPDDKTLRFGSNSNVLYKKGTTLVYIRFTFSNLCLFKTTDIFSIKAYLNGYSCSYKLTPAANYKPIADFTNPKLCAATPVVFIDASKSVSPIKSWRWNFGSGPSDSTATVNKLFANNGNLAISLIVTSTIGCKDTIKKKFSVNTAPQSAFTALSDCKKDSVKFSNLSTIASGSITAWVWDFGDAGSSNAFNPMHSYKNGGTYTVTLQAVSDSGCSTTSAKKVVLNRPIARFTTGIRCTKGIINFTDLSSIPSGSIVSWQWWFGEGTTSNFQNPKNTYTFAGNYKVSLKITSDNGCSDSISLPVNVEDRPVVFFGSDLLEGCLPLNTHFTETSIVSTGAHFFWSFGDGDTSTFRQPDHLYPKSGNYSVKLKVVNSAGCSDSLIKNKYVKVYTSPKAGFKASNDCINTSVLLADTSKFPPGMPLIYKWSFGDGGTSDLKNPSHQYANPGTFEIGLRVYTSKSCSDSTTKKFTIGTKPLSKFGVAGPLTGCAPFKISFIDSSLTDPETAYHWTFGDSHFSNLKNPTLVFQKNGNYNVKLVLHTPLGCLDSITKNTYVHVTGPSSKFNVSPLTNKLPNTSLTFISKSTQFDNLLWNFGDSTLTNQKNPSHIFQKAGFYKVCLKASNNAGCASTYCDSIKVSSYLTVAIPLAFTPNGDNVNDILYVRGGPMAEMDFRIFNEWGNMLFVSANQQEGWDGNFMNSMQPTGTYEYALKGKTIDNKPIDIHGVVHLVR